MNAIRGARIVAAGVLVAALAACGGGGSSSGPGPAASLAGLYEGSGGSNRASELLLLDSGRYYLVYGLAPASAAPVGGVVIGDATVGGNGFASANAHDSTSSRGPSRPAR